MSDFIKNNLAVVIIGDEENKQFDGKIKMNGKKEGFLYHIDSIKQIVKELNKEGYALNNINFSTAHESGFSLISMGHILFCNCTMGSITFGYLYLPARLTDKQIESLKVFESNLRQFEQLYLMKVDSLDNQAFESDTTSYDFEVDQLINTYYKVKTK